MSGFVMDNKQKGAFLMALGKQMLMHDLSAVAAMDGNSHMDIRNEMVSNGIDGETADQIMALNFDEITEALDGGF